MTRPPGVRASETDGEPSGLRDEVARRLTPADEDGRDLDVAIVGGGPAGLYTAYRLVASDASPYDPEDVDVIERSDRIGGRLDSIRPPGLDTAGELGGMRFEPDSHRIVNALVSEVFDDRLDVVDFPLGEPANHYRYLRGQRFRADAWRVAQEDGEEFETRYYLEDGDAGFSPGQLFRKVIYDVLAADPWFRDHYGDQIERASAYEHHITLDRRAWNEIKRRLRYEFDGPYEGLTVSEMGMWTLLQDQIGREGYQFLTDAMGYDALTANWNAAQAMADVALDFSSEPSFETLAGGFDRIAYALADAVLDAGGTVRTQNELRTFREAPSADRRYALTVRHRPSGRDWTIRANRIVLAMPRRALERLDQQNFFFDDEDLQRRIGAVFTQPALKLLLAFEEPWWSERFGAEAGESITDLPIRQCYYFGTNETDGDDRALLLASYDDERAVTFWSDLANETVRREPRGRHPIDDENWNELRATKAPPRMVDEALSQLEELHGVDVPEPYAAYYKNWANDPYGGGYNHWKPDFSIRDVMQHMRRPDPEEAVHVVGSAYSGRQGWVEGALCTAEKALRDELGLDWPTWLDDDYYLGW